MAQFTIYRSTDTSAPTLSGTAGDLVNLLDKCLVTGYGSKNAAGWTKPFTGTNKATFRNAGGCQMYLRVQDDAPHGTALGAEARLTGYETMSDVDTGTNSFPTASQGISGVNTYFVARKSATQGNSATQRPWIIVADSRTAYVFIDISSSNEHTIFVFGEIYSFKSTTDDYRNILIARSGEGTATASNETFGTLSSTVSSSISGHVIARSYTGVGTSLAFGKHGDGLTSVMLGNNQYPNGPDGGLYLSPIWVHEPIVSAIRGKLRGIYQYRHALNTLTNGDTFDGIGDYAGKSFLVIRDGNVGGSYHPIIIEVSDTIDTN